jgi:hypothetical protein
LFEKALEKRKGWASGLNPDGLGRQLWRGSFLACLVEKPYITVYHLLMFGGVLPAILFIQCSLVRLLSVGDNFTVRYQILAIWHVGSVHFVPLYSCLAAWLAIGTTEDVLWFALNWYYPKSLEDLVSGNIWWHTRWIHSD